MFKRRRHFFRIMSFPQHETLLTLTFESTFSSLRGRRLKGKGKGALGKGVLGEETPAT